MKKTKTERSLLRLSAAAMLAGVMILAGCSGGGDQPPVDTSVEDAATDRKAINDAIGAAETAVAAVNDASDAATVAAADSKVADARSAIAAAANIPAAEKTAFTGTVDALDGRLTAAKNSRTAAMDDDQKAEDMAMMAKANKLLAGIVRRNTTEGADERNAEYAGSNDANIMVTIGTGESNETTLTAQKATVAALNGWEGKKYADPADGDSYEAVVYSNVVTPEGLKFASPTTNDAYQYTLDANSNTELTMNDENADAGWASRVASSSFDQKAGIKSFTSVLLSGDRIGKTISGSYHGVSGTYTCVVTSPNKCAAEKTSDGFTLGGVNASNVFGTGNGTWTFKAGSNETKVMGIDTAYASYGWWLKTSEDGKTMEASAFTDNKGTAPTGLEIGGLRGTATYKGGAAGQYALHSSTGGMNDAGNFTADATLEATFAANHKITGTIDNFMGADGKSRNWSVELKEAGISDNGGITGTATGVAIDAQNPHVGTVWTIDGTAAAKSGQWLGNLQERGKDGVPMVGKGTFYTEHSNSGKMVGSFGVNHQ